MGITVGLHKILSLLESEDATVRIHAVKVVANLAAEGNLFSTQSSQVQKEKSGDSIFFTCHFMRLIGEKVWW